MQQPRKRLTGQLGRQLSYTSWAPQSPPRALMVLVHGYGEHIGRYEHVAQELVRQGYIVFGMDHRGHGESEGERANVERFDYFIDDLRLLVEEARKEFPDLPFFMVAHSMGSLIGLRYALRYQEEMDGLVVSGVGLEGGDDVPTLVKKMAGLLARIAPSIALVELATGDNLLSRDPEIKQRFDRDPLCYTGKLKFRMGAELLVAAQDTLARLSELTLPLLIMHGTEDRLTKPSGAQRLYDETRSTDKTLKLWPEMLHEIFNELEKEAVIQTMLDWLDERVRRAETRMAEREQVG